eukprot:TRINITY_DN86841_c0_g1_i1.p1 TRINITY_DN86841_c0_g1~~TRINITY_DN86841_c0_g1_i1.p1  ORF type:complete len:101 (-),score=27.87 TRINITY_DN86841_c0_g1_i1:25-327(-)
MTLQDGVSWSLRSVVSRRSLVDQAARRSQRVRKRMKYHADFERLWHQKKCQDDDAWKKIKNAKLQRHMLRQNAESEVTDVNNISHAVEVHRSSDAADVVE